MRKATLWTDSESKGGNIFPRLLARLSFHCKESVLEIWMSQQTTTASLFKHLAAYLIAPLLPIPHVKPLLTLPEAACYTHTYGS